MSEKQCEGTHKFEGRYDVIVPKGRDGSPDLFAVAAGVRQDKIYVHDICVQCGKKVTR